MSYRMICRKEKKKLHRFDYISMLLVSVCYAIGLCGAWYQILGVKVGTFSPGQLLKGGLPALVEGGRLFCKQVLVTISQFSGYILPTPAIRDMEMAKGGFMLLCVIFFLILFSFTIFFVKNHNRNLLLILFLSVVIGGNLLHTPSGIFPACMACSLFFIWKETLPFCIFFVAFAALFVFFAIGSFSLPEAGAGVFHRIKSEVIRQQEKFRYGENEVLPEGDFQKVKGFSPSGETMLEVYMSVPDSYYLRGFVGSEYTKEGWRALHGEKEDKTSDLFYWLHKEKFYGQTQLADLAMRLDREKQSASMTIQNVNATSKYLYLPYEITTFMETDKGHAEGRHDIDKRWGDERFTPKGIFGERTYQFLTLPNQIKNYTDLSAALAVLPPEKEDDYRQNEAHYNEYIYSNYLEVPEHIRVLLQDMLGEYNQGEEMHASYALVKQKIISNLTKSFAYSEKVSGTGETDFLESFLQKERQGYSVHFATAAVMMFRYYHIPARYVEGYLITPENVKGKAADEKIEITDWNSHAWVEFYQDGVGFVPFEVTPGYLAVMETADDISGIDEGQQGEKEKQTHNNAKKDDEETANNIGLRQKETVNYEKWFKYAIIIICVLLWILIFCFLCCLVYRMGKRRRILAKKDNRAVCLLFSEILDFLKKRKLISGYREFYKGIKEFQELSGVLDIYEKARFSPYEIEKAEFDIVMDFHKRIKSKR